MHIARDYPQSVQFMHEVVNGHDLMTLNEMIVLFVDKYKQLELALNNIKGEHQCHKCQNQQKEQLKSSSQQKKRGRPKKSISQNSQKKTENS